MRKFIVACLMTLAPAAAAAQNPPPTPAECQQAIDSLQAGSRNVRAWGFIAQCGSAGAAALAARMNGLGAEADTVYLVQLLASISLVKDSAVFRASRAIANNPSATVVTRATALQAMLTQYSPGGNLFRANGWAHFTGTPRGLSCQMMAFNAPHRYAGPLPSDYLAQMAATLDSIVFRPGENAVIRDLAGCVRMAIKSQVPLSVPPSAITLTYVCGTQYRAANSSSRSASLRYRLQGTSEDLGLFVPANATQDFLTLKAGPVEVLQNGALIGTVKNGGTGCP